MSRQRSTRFCTSLVLLLFRDSPPLLLVNVACCVASSWLGKAAADVHDIAGPSERNCIGIIAATENLRYASAHR